MAFSGRFFGNQFWQKVKRRNPKLNFLVKRNFKVALNKKVKLWVSALNIKLWSNQKKKVW